jgi:hypothetical protein
MQQRPASYRLTVGDNGGAEVWELKNIEAA